MRARNEPRKGLVFQQRTDFLIFERIVFAECVLIDLGE